MDILGTAGGLWTNYQNRQFAEEMASTQYQRAVADMKQAGLNPMAMFQQSGGPAAAPEGQSTNPVVGTLGGTAKQVADIRQSLASGEKIGSEDELVKAQADSARSVARASASRADVEIAENEAYKRMLSSEPGRMAAAVNKYGKNWIGSAGAIGGLSAGSSYGGDSAAKKFGYWLKGDAPNSQYQEQKFPEESVPRRRGSGYFGSATGSSKGSHSRSFPE